MQNSSNIFSVCQVNTLIHIAFESDISDELGNTLPYPQHHYTNGDKMVYVWLIDGFFKTSKNIRFLNDIIARFKITFNDCQYIKKQEVKKTSSNALKLRHFQNLKSRVTSEINERTQFDGARDYIFWCLKFYAEDVIKEKQIVVYDDLESFAIDNFIDDAKDFSTLKSKCRSIINYYINNNYTISKNTKYQKKDKGEVMATRQEHAKKLNKDREDKARKKVLNIVTGMFADEYKKANGKWNITKIAKDSNTSRPTVMKHLKELK